MFRRLLVPLLASMFLTLQLATTSLAGSDFDGSVVSVGADQLVLLVNEEQQTFVVNGDTRITVDGQPATLADVMISHIATVSAEFEDDQWIAKSLSAHAIK